MEVKPAEFARIAGVSRASISEKIKKNTLILNSAGMLDTENPVNARYISNHQQKAARAAADEYAKQGGGSGAPPRPAGPVSPGKPPATAAPGAPPDDFTISQLAGGIPRELLSLSIRELILRYPGIEKIERYAKILKDLTMSAEKEQRIQERSLVLIDKDFVVSNLFEFINALIKQTIEYPESIIDQIIALAQAHGEAARGDIITLMRDGLSRVIAGAKDQIISNLNSLKSKYQNDTKNEDKFNELKEAIEEGRRE